jgi:hypothetical protein
VAEMPSRLHRRLAGELHRHELGGWAHRVFDTYGVQLATEPARELRADWRATQARSIEALAGYEDLSRVLDEAGVEHAPLKGIGLLQSIYSDEVGSRVLGDLDVLVRRHDLGRCREALSKAGYNTESERSYVRCQRFAHHVHYTGGAHLLSIPIELHWRMSLVQGANALDLWEGAAPNPGRADSREVRLSPASFLYSLLIHIAAHVNHVSLKWLLDLRLLLEKVPECASPAALVARAREAGTLAACYYALCMTSLFTASAAAETLRAAIAELLPMHRERMVRGLGSPFWMFRAPSICRSKWPTYGCGSWLPDHFALRYRVFAEALAFKLHLERVIS